MLFMFMGLRTAFNTLTIIPTGLRPVELHKALSWFPLTGALLASIMLGVSALLNLAPGSSWHAGIAVLMVFLGIVLTRGLHLDGLADWADSVGGIFDREKRLAIMKDVHTGAFGAAALVVDILARWAAFDVFMDRGIFFVLVPVMTVSRAMMTELITTLPYAGKTQGMAAPFVEGASNRHRFLSLFMALACCTPFGPAGLGVLVTGFIMTCLLKRYFLRHYGGITGDLLGASNEILEVLLMFILAFTGDYAVSLTSWSMGYPV